MKTMRIMGAGLLMILLAGCGVRSAEEKSSHLDLYNDSVAKQKKTEGKSCEGEESCCPEEDEACCGEPAPLSPDLQNACAAFGEISPIYNEIGCIVEHKCVVDQCPLFTPPPQDFCKCPEVNTCPDGEVITSTTYEDSLDGKMCKISTQVCVTRNAAACPQFSPPGPDYCKEGTLVSGETSYIASADGMMCRIPSLVCLTDDPAACPQFSPPDPNYCMDGELVSETAYVESADGMMCAVPRLICLTRDMAACSAALEPPPACDLSLELFHAELADGSGTCVIGAQCR